VALLRGISAGGHNKVAMADLRQIAADLARARRPALTASAAQTGGTARNWATVTRLTAMLGDGE
jgi:uncharacterized protein (DUF1697 family)